MGREIRKVPPNWSPPKRDPEQYPYRDGYQPTYNQHFEDALDEWVKDFDRVRRGELDEFEAEHYAGLGDWIQDYQPPDKRYYRQYRDEDATWFQVYETVSAGTPVTPAFETKEELVQYLARIQAGGEG